MKNCPKFGKVILVAIVHELYKSGLGEIMFDKVTFMFSAPIFPIQTIILLKKNPCQAQESE
jgi:hypothetical protein